MDNTKSKSEIKSKQQAKEDKLAQALRDNLRRRKSANSGEKKENQ